MYLQAIFIVKAPQLNIRNLIGLELLHFRKSRIFFCAICYI